LRFLPSDLILSEHDVLEPDPPFVLNEHLDILQDWVCGASDLVIEIPSSSTQGRNRGIKLKAYAHDGVGEYWIVNPITQAIEVYHLGAEGYRLAGTCSKDMAVENPLVQGLSLAASSFFKL
jgi:Uma2 family endonuclease